MSIYACPGCGEDAPLSQECSRCEFEAGVITDGQNLAWPGRLIKHVLLRLRATRSQLLQEMQEHTQSVAMLRDEAARERRMAENLASNLSSMRKSRDVAMDDADESRRLRDLAIKSLGLRTKDLLGVQDEALRLREAAYHANRRRQTETRRLYRRRSERDDTIVKLVELIKAAKPYDWARFGDIGSSGEWQKQREVLLSELGAAGHIKVEPGQHETGVQS